MTGGEIADLVIALVSLAGAATAWLKAAAARDALDEHVKQAGKGG